MSFSFIQISDHHLRERDDILSRAYNTAYAFRRVLAHIANNNAHRADFLITTGDIVDNGTDAEYRATFERLKLELTAQEPPGPHFVSGEGLPRLPMYFLPGNHDPRDVYFRNLFPSAPARAWNNTAFTHKGIQFVTMDCGAENTGVFYPETAEFLANALESGQPTIILSHHPVVRVGVDWLDAFLSGGIENFWEIVRGKNVLGVLSGHLHMSYTQIVGGIPVFGLRATTFQFAPVQEKLFCLMPPHYRIVTVQDNNISTELVQVEL
jgi:3',5'-cyclic AMP phosphodiesterase CpdA